MGQINTRADALLAHLEELQEAHHLEPAAVREQVARPSHEFVQPADFLEDLQLENQAVKKGFGKTSKDKTIISQ